MFTLVAAGTVLLAVILCRTRRVVTWPVRTTLPSAAGRPSAPAPRRVRPAPSLPGWARARTVTAVAARPAVAGRQPLAIEARASVPVRIGVPTGPGSLAMVAWPWASAPPGLRRGPVPEAALARGEHPSWPGPGASEAVPEPGYA